MSTPPIKIYYPSQYPAGVSPSQRFRIEQYIPFLKKESIHFKIEPFISETFYGIFFQKGHTVKKITAIILGFAHRLLSLFTLHKFDYIFIQREASPIGPPILEWLYARVFRKKIIYDFDDAIWLSRISDNNRIGIYLKCFWKIKKIIGMSHHVIAGNKFLYNYAKKYNNSITLLPTCIDTAARTNFIVNQDTALVTIGWTGSFSTNEYLEKLYPVLHQLQQELSFNLIVISNKRPTFVLDNMEYIEWNESVEVETLAKCQIGLMPMERDEWSRGKCGFKLIQYMALGIVPMADAWGANNEIIENDVSGILVYNHQEWFEKLKAIIIDASKRKSIGLEAVKKATEIYSTENNLPLLISLFSNTSLP